MAKIPVIFYRGFLLPLVALLSLSMFASARPVRAAGPINLHNDTYVCKTFQDHQIVNVTEDDNGSEDGVFINDGCTGTLDVHIITNAVDGIKVHSGDHKGLIITGSIVCVLKHGIAHQDGVQAMGGSNVQLGDGVHDGSFIVHCPTGNNGGLWVNTGSGGHEVPTNIVCDHCNLFEGNASLHINNSVGSGARNTVLHNGVGGAAPADCKRINSGAVNPVTGPSLTCVLPPPPLNSDDAANYHGYTGPYGPAQTGCGLTAGGCWLAGGNPPPPSGTSPGSTVTPPASKPAAKPQPKASSSGVGNGIERILGISSSSPNKNSSLVSNAKHSWRAWLILTYLLPIVPSLVCILLAVLIFLH
jgi:hypothetical protein